MTARGNVLSVVPGMAPRAPKRNVVVASVYALVLVMLLF
jgi:hypothetical protein